MTHFVDKNLLINNNYFLIIQYVDNIDGVIPNHSETKKYLFVMCITNQLIIIRWLFFYIGY